MVALRAASTLAPRDNRLRRLPLNRLLGGMRRFLLVMVLVAGCSSVDTVTGDRASTSSESDLAKELASIKEAWTDPDRPNCLPPEVKSGVVKIDCSPFVEPIKLYDEVSGQQIAVCSFWACHLLDDEAERKTCQTKCPRLM